jgi:hypothetical protein
MSGTLKSTIVWHVTPTFRRNICLHHLQNGSVSQQEPVRPRHSTGRRQYVLRNVGEFLPDTSHKIINTARWSRVLPEKPNFPPLRNETFMYVFTKAYRWTGTGRAQSLQCRSNGLGKRVGLSWADANHSPPSTAEGKNEWFCTSPTPVPLHGEVLN